MFRARTVAVLLAFAAVATACGRQGGEPTAAGPLEPVRNLLVICIDTVRADTFYQLGELEQDRLRTWQDRALVFKQASAPAPWTVPSIASAFTGLWPKQHGAGLIDGLKQIDFTRSMPSVLHPDVKTLAQTARDDGFQTTVVSASQWTFDDENPVDISRGFDRFYEYVPELTALDFPFWEPMLQQWNELIDNQPADDRVLNFVHFIDAHNWHMALPRQLNPILHSLTPKQRKRYRSMAPAPACEDMTSLICKRFTVYAHSVSVLRDAVADMLDAMEKRGQLADTAVVLFSDHGEEFHDHFGEAREHSLSGEPVYLGHGISLYEEQLHVPLVVWHPGIPGNVIHTPVSLIDIAPSAAAWLGLAFAPEEGQGRLLHEQPANPAKDDGRVLYASNMAYGEKQTSTRKGPEKAIWYMASDRINYFDLAQDPDELVPLDPGKEMVLAFDGRFLEYEQMKQDGPAEMASFTREQMERLQAIGYLQGVENEDPAEE